MNPAPPDPFRPVLLILLPCTVNHPPRRLLQAIRDATLTHDQRAQVICRHTTRPSHAITLRLTGDWSCVPEHLWRTLTHLYTDYQ